MTTKRFKAVAWKLAASVTGAAVLTMVSPASVYAATETPTIKLGPHTTATCTRTFPEVCLQPTPGNDISAKIDLGQNFRKAGLRVTLVCIQYTFDPSDPVGPGEELQQYPYGGFSNIGTTDILARESCIADYGLGLLENFQDGKYKLHIFAQSGSFRVATVSVSYTAVPM